MSLPRYDDALRTILSAVTPVGGESLSTDAALGRVPAVPLTVPDDVPDGSRSAMDGYAVGSCARCEFDVVGEVAAGAPLRPPLAPHQAAAVMTGALVPPGTAAVVMLEQAGVEGDRLTVSAEIRPDDLVNLAGSEARAGDPLVPAGRRLDATTHAAVMCAGHATLAVHRQPRVGLIITGDEVRSAHESPREGAVFDTNTYILQGVCAALGCRVIDVRRVADDEAATRRHLAELDDACDIVVTSGGVSTGRHDHMGRILRADAPNLLLAGTAIKPGRPMHVARLGRGTPVFAMPGYPTSLLTNAFLYLVPALKRLAGRHDTATTWFDAVLDTPMRHRAGRQDLGRVALRIVDGRWHAASVGSQTTSHFLDHARAHGLARLPLAAPAVHDGGALELPAGATVPVLHFALELA